MRDLSRRGFLQVSSAAALGAGLWNVLPAAAHAATEETNIEKAFISFRIGVPQWLNDERYRGLLAVFEKYKGVTDEVTFFTSETHPPLPLEVIQQRAEILKQRMIGARALGYRSGINLLATMGHHNENLPNSLQELYTRFTDIAGNVCQGCFCPNDEGMRGYIAEVYKAITAAEPDYIWVDDDVRLLGHMPISQGCFCDTCLEIFEKEVGKKYDRAALREAFNQTELQAKLEIRNAWLNHNRKTMIRLLGWIEQTAHAIKPGLPLGFMTGERFYEGFDFDGWAGALSGPNNSEVRWRPGGGNYTDEVPDGTAQKAHQIGRQIFLLPPSVKSIQSEIESFPYQRLRKSAHMTSVEAAAYIASGCTGAAFNVLSMYDDPLDEYDPLVSRLRDVRPFLDRMAHELGRTPVTGIHAGWCKNSYAAINPAADWFTGPRQDLGTGHTDGLYTLGLPPAYGAAHGRVTALTNDTALALSDEEVRRMLSAGVYMDADALTRLNSMGYEKFTGFTVERTIERDCIEQFTEDELNAGFSGRRRDCRQSFWYGPAQVFAKTGETCRTLAQTIDYSYQETAPCCLGVFENELGGRICVAGYYPWVQLHGLAKSSQIKSIMRWLSRDTLPAYVSSFHRINLWPRVREDGTMAVALLNASLDAAENLELCLLTTKNKLAVIDMQCREAQVIATHTDGPYKRFILPPVEPWNLRLAVTE
ncbi:MAG TPA: hypothetical protein PLI09_01760 [Candidatus Hydrogenedentes bacterium]|nr:hypothetical protein [Candidatus Hydrogenedentota bacterium]